MMIEDALKSTRNIHRLIISISFITLVFSLSIDFPSEIKKQKDFLSKLVKIDLTAYQKFVDSQVIIFQNEHLKPIAAEINSKISGHNFMIFNLESFKESFEKNIHVGQVLVKDLIFSDLSDATLNALDATNELSINRNIQVLKPINVDSISNEIISFLKDKYRVGLRVNDLRILPMNVDFITESFLYEKSTFISVYFDLPANINPGGAPVFNSDFEAEVVEIPNTSFSDWLFKYSTNGEILKKSDDGEILWLPTLKERPSGFNEKRIGLLIENLTKKISESSLEQQNVSLLGTSIPGILFIYASPLILFGLIYYLLNHLIHLRVFSIDYSDDFKKFSWSPINFSWVWKYDLIISIAFFPLLSLIILYIQLLQFGSISFLPSFVLFFCFICIIVLGIKIFRNVVVIRSYIYKLKAHSDEIE